MTTATNTVELDNLDKIALEAMGGEIEDQAKQDAILNPNPEPVIDPAKTWAQIPFMLGGMLAMAMPELKQVYTEAACMTWGQGMAAVSDKYGWDAGETISRWAPEFMLVAASMPLLVPTVRAVKARAEAAKARAPEKAPEAVAGAQGAAAEPVNPMMAEPGGFSVPV
jgi:hypothetical protein